MNQARETESVSPRTIPLLLIEDDEEDKFVIDRILKRVSGVRYVVDWVSSTADLAARLVENRYDVILLDFFLGPKNASDLISEISALAESTAIIVLTGQNSSEADEAAFGMAIDFFLSKSDLSPGGIDRAIRYAIRNRDQQVRLRNFSRLVAHDLMGPAGNIRIAAETLGMILTNCEGDQQALLEVLQNDSENLVSTLSALHDFSISQDGRLEAQETSLEEVLSMALANLNIGNALEEGRVVCGPLPDMQVDPKLFTHVFQNLIQNGLKYNKSDRPRVEIEAKIAEGACELSFRDNGIGIDPSKVFDVFRPMYRLHGSSEYEGTGLGLAVCKEVVERHGGSIWLESSGIAGQGCSFFIKLSAFPNR